MKTWITGGMVLDGSGAGPKRADLLVENGRIAAVAKYRPTEGARLIEADGMVVTPGFIDMHRHCDIAPFRDPAFGRLELAQGITTAVVGNCGIAPVPVPKAFADDYAVSANTVIGTLSPRFDDYPSYFNALRSAALPINIGVLAATGAIRVAVKGFRKTAFTMAQISQAQELLQSALCHGALGASSGLMYAPEHYNSPSEHAALLMPAARAQRPVSIHMRGEGDLLVSSVDEVIALAEHTGLHAHISHFKSSGIANHNRLIHQAIEHIESARARGTNITVDFYPYHYGSTTMLSLLPPEMLKRSVAQTLANLATRQGKNALRKALTGVHPRWDNMVASIGWERIFITEARGHADYCGQSMADIAAQNQYAHPCDLLCDLLVEEGGQVGIAVQSMSPADVDTVARLPYSAIISDALYADQSAAPHPRLYGAFPRAIRELVVERGVLSLPTAVYKMTGLPASILGLAKRGFLRQGYAADILVFDPAKIRDEADYQQPCRLSKGMAAVFVNGQLAYQNETYLPAHSGQVLKPCL